MQLTVGKSQPEWAASSSQTAWPERRRQYDLQARHHTRIPAALQGGLSQNNRAPATGPFYGGRLSESPPLLAERWNSTHPARPGMQQARASEANPDDEQSRWHSHGGTRGHMCGRACSRQAPKPDTPGEAGGPCPHFSGIWHSHPRGSSLTLEKAPIPRQAGTVREMAEK